MIRDLMTTRVPTMCVLNYAEQQKAPKLSLVTKLDWAKTRCLVDGEWPKPLPPWRYIHDNDYTDNRLDEWISAAMQSGRVYADVENYWHKDWPNGDSSWDGHIYAIGFGYDDDDSDVLIWHELNDPHHMNRYDLGEFMRKLYSRVPATTYHNGFHDIKKIHQNFLITREEYAGLDDTMLQMGVYWSELPKALDFCASIMGSQNKHKQLGTQSSEYLVGDIVATRDSERELRLLLEQDAQTKWVYDNIQRPLIPIVHDAHMRGIRVDQDEVGRQATKLKAQRDEAIETAQAYCGYPINLNTSKDVSAWLFDYEEIEPIRGQKRGKNGAFSLRKDNLAKYQDQFAIRDHDIDETLDERIAVGGHPLIEALAKHNEVAGLITNFINKCDSKERIYPNFKIHQQATGRWSTVDPPLSGMPGPLKELMIPDYQHVHVGGDSANIELRLIAYIANDQLLIDAFDKGYDLHSTHAAQAFGWNTVAGRLEWIGDTGFERLYDVLGTALTDDIINRLIYDPDYNVDTTVACPHYLDRRDVDAIDAGAGRGWSWAQWKQTKMPGALCNRCWLSWALHGGPPPDWEADDDMRRRFAKAFVYRLLYGGSPKTAHTIPGANQLGLPIARVNAASQRWADTHTALIAYWDNVHTLAVNERCVRTVFGRPRRLLNPDIERVKRAASNHPIQGTAADFLNFTVLGVADRAPYSYLVLTCHDSIKFGAPLEHASDLWRIVKEEAERPRDVYGVDVSIPFEDEYLKIGRVGYGYDLLFVDGQEKLLAKMQSRREQKGLLPYVTHDTNQGTVIRYHDFKANMQS